MRQIRLEPISEEAFAPFGRLVRHVGTSVIADACTSFTADPAATIPILEWVRLANSLDLPFRVERLERHPFSAQTFLPGSQSDYLVFVCPTGVDGTPDLQSIRAFLVQSNLGITFHRGVWHHSLAPLAQPSRFIMAMMRTGLDNDTEFHDLVAPNQIEVIHPHDE